MGLGDVVAVGDGLGLTVGLGLADALGSGTGAKVRVGAGVGNGTVAVGFGVAAAVGLGLALGLGDGEGDGPPAVSGACAASSSEIPAASNAASELCSNATVTVSDRPSAVPVCASAAGAAAADVVAMPSHVALPLKVMMYPTQQFTLPFPSLEIWS